MSGNCGSDGGRGIGAGHVCLCNREAGHPLDGDRFHGCECGALWSCPDCPGADPLEGCAGCGAAPLPLPLDHEAQIRDLLEEREELLTEIRRLRMGNHPAGRALLGYPADHIAPLALAEALTERDAEHEGGGGA